MKVAKSFYDFYSFYMSNNFSKKYAKRRYPHQDRKEKIFGLTDTSNVFIVKAISEDKQDFCFRIHTFIPRHPFKDASPDDHVLVPSSKHVTLNPYDCWQLIQALEKILPPKENTSPTSENYFGEVSPPANFIIEYNDSKIIETDKVSRKIFLPSK